MHRNPAGKSDLARHGIPFRGVGTVRHAAVFCGRRVHLFAEMMDLLKGSCAKNGKTWGENMENMENHI
jgi:hypothetical protein